MRFTHILVTLSALTLLTACGGEMNTVQVESYKVPCFGLVNGMCLLTQTAQEEVPSVNYDGIYGFTHEWGKTYEIVTETTHLSDPPMDGSSIQVDLIEIVKEELVPAGTTFSFVISPDQYKEGYAPHVQQISTDDNTQWRTLDQQPFSCTGAVCESLVGALEGEAATTLEFEFQEDLSMVLISVSTI